MAEAQWVEEVEPFGTDDNYVIDREATRVELQAEAEANMKFPIGSLVKINPFPDVFTEADLRNNPDIETMKPHVWRVSGYTPDDDYPYKLCDRYTPTYERMVCFNEHELIAYDPSVDNEEEYE
jgi:hypothetical protein